MIWEIGRGRKIEEMKMGREQKEWEWNGWEIGFLKDGLLDTDVYAFNLL